MLWNDISMISDSDGEKITFLCLEVDWQLNKNDKKKKKKKKKKSATFVE